MKEQQDLLMELNVNDKLEEKNGLNYLSWAWAWMEFIKVYPDAVYEVKKDDRGVPYFSDHESGVMVYTSVTAGGVAREMWLPIMDGSNKPMREDSYEYQVKEYKGGKWTGNYITKTCEAFNMFDVNKTIMRCLTKNLSMFGLGLYIYAGEDIPGDINNNIELIRESRKAYLNEYIPMIMGLYKSDVYDIDMVKKQLQKIEEDSTFVFKAIKAIKEKYGEDNI